MKIWFVKSATADNYILVETADGLLSSNCAPDGCFAGISLCGCDDNGNEIPGEVIADKIARAIDPDLSDDDFAWMGDACLDSFEDWEAEQETFEPFNQDEAFPICAKPSKDEERPSVGKYNYQELHDRAFAPDATQEDINALGEWFERFSEGRFWNGEVHDIDGLHSIRPVQVYDEEHDCWDITGYEIV